MTVPELIANVLENLRRHFYTDTETGIVRVREFKRDERQLIKAIATYGYECCQRGWQFEVDFIYHDMNELLLKMRTSGADIGYLPVYLAGAIRRHLGLRAEVLSAKAKLIQPRVHRILTGLKTVQMVNEPTAVEMFTEVYRGIQRIQRQRRGKRATKECQEKLL